MRLVWIALLVVAASCGRIETPAPEAPAVDRSMGWRHARTNLYLDDRAPETQVFRFSGLDAARMSIPISSIAKQRLWVRGRCDGAGEVEAAQDGVSALRGFTRDAPFAFDLPSGARDAAVLVPGPDVRTCRLQVRGADGLSYRLRLEREELSAPLRVRQLDAGRGGCHRSFGSVPGDALAAIMAAPGRGALSVTCPMPAGDGELMPDAREAFQARAMALTGARLPDAVLDSGNAMAAIDFTNAPELDLIYISSLHMRADFTGYMLTRMLAWHAARGTVIRIMLTDSLQLSLDRNLYADLAARFPNVQLQMFRAGGLGQGDSGAFDRLHRANHVKVFATLARRPGRSVFMIGGRNLHDGFTFDQPRDLSPWPFLRSYTVDRMYSIVFFFAAYRDLEMRFDDEAVVRRMAAHMAAYWHRDHDSQALADPQGPRADNVPAAALRGGTMRHFVSVPYTDGRALEQLYVDLFDAAQRRIDMTSPFLNMTPRIAAAMERALARGVSLRLVTRTEIPEPATIFATTLNRLFVEAYADRMTILAHDPRRWTLHSKILVVDARLAVISSTNLNQRSFLHDTENGVLILDRAQAGRVLRLIDEYGRDSMRQENEQPISGFLRRVMSLGFVRRLF